MALNMGFPNPRRIVTGHDDKGEAIVVADSEIEPAPILGLCNFAVLWETHDFPTTDNNEFDDPIKKTTESLSNQNGVVLRIVDFPAKTKTFMHRTVSLDFGMLFSGEIECHLDNDIVITMKAGDVCVQRGTIHAWINPFDKPARVYFVLTAAKPLEIAGKNLEPTGFKDDEMSSGGH